MKTSNHPKEAQSKPPILLIDDHEEILDFLADDLGETYQVFTAKDGREGLDQLFLHPIQLIVSDIMMPGMNGFDFCRIVKSTIEYSHVPIIMLTAQNTLNSKIEGLELGADAYIEKPFSPEHLQAQIASLLNNRIKIREYFANSPLVHINSMAHTRADETFLERLNGLIQDQITNQRLGVEQLADLMYMSRPTLYRKIKAISNLSPNDFIKIARLKKAAELLCNGDYKIYEVSEMVGYSSQTHFGRNFQKQFGISPSEYVLKEKNRSRQGNK
ncbi:Helix-turn-helix domain-containing protein [bacterium A37T11]|nr:Helix-turn-helix domain-containing protein [bacterium A37T11]